MNVAVFLQYMVLSFYTPSKLKQVYILDLIYLLVYLLFLKSNKIFIFYYAVIFNPRQVGIAGLA